MKRVLLIAVGALALVAVERVAAEEGRVSDATTASPDIGRASKYADGPVKADELPHSGQVHNSKGSASPRLAKSAATPKPKRAAAIAQSSRFADFSIHEVRSSLIRDRDGDGHASEFRIRFDVDTVFAEAEVHAALYLRRFGERDWTLYHETDDFDIHGSSDSDDFFVTTTLDDGFPTGFYDVLIDVYEVGFDGIAATVGPFETGALADLPLEEAGLDVPVQIPGYAIDAVRTTLIIDDDRDGYYSRFRIDFDPDAAVAGSYVYAVVWVRAAGGDWIEEHVSDDFLVDASGSADAYGVTADWLSGYPTSYYDVQIDLHDAATGALVASAGSERPELSRVPLEDAGRDQRVNGPTGGSSAGGNTSSSERGGGSLTWWMLLAFLPLLIARRWQTLRCASNVRSRVLKNVFNTLLIGPRMAQPKSSYRRWHAQFYVLAISNKLGGAQRKPRPVSFIRLGKRRWKVCREQTWAAEGCPNARAAWMVARLKGHGWTFSTAC